ncbi:MAG: SDR family oxidoreductase, partial [Eubacteriales bacterium]|nr:SDR family oxidoreductase [Eubacteriales bacterium]
MKDLEVSAPNGADAWKDNILITGASGFLGTQVTRLILAQNDHPVIVIVRGQDLCDAKNRLKRIWWDWPELISEIDNRIEVIAGDLSLPQFGLNDVSYRGLAEKVGTILHLAADIRLDAPPDELDRSNVSSVRNLLELARHIYRHHGLERFSYVSTAYVAGGREGIVPEDELSDRYGFSNHYERSKFEGEFLVREAGKEIPVTVFRPGMVVGDSMSGTVKAFNTVYFPLRLYLTGKLKFLPVNPAMKINLIPCDYVAEAISKLTFEPKAAGVTFHLTLPREALPTVREMIQLTREWASENLHVRLPAPVFLPFPISRLKWLGRFFRGKSAVRSLLSLAAYFEEDRIYRRDNLDRLAGTYQGNWRDFFPCLLTYAAD